MPEIARVQRGVPKSLLYIPMCLHLTRIITLPFNCISNLIFMGNAIVKISNVSKQVMHASQRGHIRPSFCVHCPVYNRTLCPPPTQINNCVFPMLVFHLMCMCSECPPSFIRPPLYFFHIEIVGIVNAFTIILSCHCVATIFCQWRGSKRAVLPCPRPLFATYFQEK